MLNQSWDSYESGNNFNPVTYSQLSAIQLDLNFSNLHRLSFLPVKNFLQIHLLNKEILSDCGKTGCSGIILCLFWSSNKQY